MMVSIQRVWQRNDIRK